MPRPKKPEIAPFPEGAEQAPPEVSAYWDAKALKTPQTGISPVDQSAKGKTDINTLVAQYTDTGVLTHVNRRAPLYADVSNFPDLQGAHAVVREAQATFDALSAAVREAADNDFEVFMQMLQTEEGTADLVEAGLGFTEEEAAEPPPRIRSRTWPDGAGTGRSEFRAGGAGRARVAGVAQQDAIRHLSL